MKVPCCCEEGFLKVIDAGHGLRVDREYGAFPTSAALRDFGPEVDVTHSPPRKASIMNPVRILLATALAAGTAVLSAGGASAAAPDQGPAFGQHVSQCAKTMGFSGTHNPGVMHQGKSGWDGATMTSPMP
jgi:hypothetical protein